MNIDDLSPLPDGEVGLLAHWDLANVPTVLAVINESSGCALRSGCFAGPDIRRHVDQPFENPPRCTNQRGTAQFLFAIGEIHIEVDQDHA